VRVLILGAAGYIGTATALALRRAGHTVVGVSRQSSVPELEQNEVLVVQGDINDLKTLSTQIEEADVIIDNVLDTTKWFSANEALLKAIASAPVRNGEKRRYIYTSGCLVYGNQPGKLLTESDSLKHPALKGRIDFEQTTTKSTDVVGSVVRPGFVYGGRSSEMSGWMAPNAKGEWVIEGSTDKSWSWIHIQDLADLYVRVVEGAVGTVGGQIFNAGDSTRVTFGEMRTALARAAGYKGELSRAAAPTTGFSALIEATTVTSSAKATRLLGWQPKFLSLVDNYESVYRAWKAHQKK